MLAAVIHRPQIRPAAFAARSAARSRKLLITVAVTDDRRVGCPICRQHRLGQNLECACRYGPVNRL